MRPSNELEPAALKQQYLVICNLIVLNMWIVTYSFSDSLLDRKARILSAHFLFSWLLYYTESFFVSTTWTLPLQKFSPVGTIADEFYHFKVQFTGFSAGPQGCT